MPQHVLGTFEVTVTPQEQSAREGQMPSGRFGLLKRFTGPLSGTAHGTMLSLGQPKPGNAAAYVALDWFTGTLDGRKGGFALIHRGTMTKTGATSLNVQIAPDSGVGGLEGISGELKIDVREGRHHYELTYTLGPEAE
jgi:hypothetical protein